MKGAFAIVKNCVNDKNFNIKETLLTKSPVTPDNNKVGMGTFQLNDIRDGIISNFMMQGFNFTPYTYYQLVEFLNGDFNTSTTRAYLQLLLHFSKFNVPETYKRYQASFNASQARMLTIEEFFDRKIAGFLEGSLSAFETGSMNGTVEVIPETERQSLLSMLETEPVLMAFESSFRENLKLVCDRKWLTEQLSKIQIYSVTNFKALNGLRGACLVDGILICSSTLAPGGDKHKADLLTLAAHECGHFFARMKMGDFNFSCPHKYLEDPDVARFDPVYPDLHLEIGRSIELKLFHGIQPNWSLSKEGAATEFMLRLKKLKQLPVIRNDEYHALGIEPRSHTSPTFGIDLNEFDIVFC